MSDTARSFRIVLCRPKFSGNIGFACRAMKAMGITDLAIVGDADAEDRAQARATAVHAADVYDNARRFATLAAAIGDCSLAAGTTRRRGKHRKRAILLPEEFARQVEPLTGTIALVFGNEESGLSSAELDLCSVAITIPSSAESPSLNLSHAVQIMAYVVFRHQWNLPAYTPAGVSRVGEAVSSMSDSLTSALSGPAEVKRMRRVLTDVIGRAGVSEGELRDLEWLFARMQHQSAKFDHRDANGPGVDPGGH